MRIAVDAMGGDFAPGEIVAGTFRAAVALADQVEEWLLVGREDAIRSAAAALGPWPPRVRIVHADEVVDMGESPAVAVRRKKNSSINQAVALVRSGEAAAVFSAGNTGALVAAATLKLRPLEGVLRPAIATTIPGGGRFPWVLIDAGANTDCTAEMLVQFAVMGAVYAREILGIPEPRVGLLSVGEEDVKGNEVTREAFGRLRASPLNFVGNVEGHDLFEDQVDVVVCDGFVGNIVLKTSESVAHFFGRLLRETLTTTPWRALGAWLIRGGLRELRTRADASSYGGAPLLGVPGVCIVAHGASRAEAVANGLRVTVEAVRREVPQKVARGVQELAHS